MALTANQEAFCQAYVGAAKHNKTAAYRMSYKTDNMQDKTVWNEASVLSKNHGVAIRIMELQEECAERAAITADSLALELEEARTLALDIDQPSAAVSATLGKGKLFGLLVDKKEITGANGSAIEMDHNIVVEFVGMNESTNS